MHSRSSLLLLAIISCGGETIDPMMPAVDARAFPPGSYRTMIFIARDEGASAAGAAIIASDDTGPGWCEPDRTIAQCTVYNCLDFTTQTGGGPNPGVVTMSSIAGSVALTPNASGIYGSAGVKRLFLPNQTVRFSAPGAEFPGFDENVVAPDPITMTTDGLVTITRGQPFTVTWTGGTRTVHISIFRTVGSALTLAVCPFDATLGTGTVPGEVTAELPVGSHDMKIASSEHHRITTTAGPVEFQVQSKLHLTGGEVVE